MLFRSCMRLKNKKNRTNYHPFWALITVFVLWLLLLISRNRQTAALAMETCTVRPIPAQTPLDNANASWYHGR